MLVNHKLLGWIIITLVYLKIPGQYIAIKMMLVNRKLLGWTITTQVYREIQGSNIKT